MYPGIALFEASNVAVGLGTPEPYRWIGAPWLNAEAVLKNMEGKPLAGLRITPRDYTPSKGVYAGLPCRGLRLDMVDREKLKPMAIFLQLALALRKTNPAEFSGRWDEAKAMTWNDEFKRLYQGGAGLDRFQELFESASDEFEETRKPFLLYQETDTELLLDEHDNPTP